MFAQSESGKPRAKRPKVGDLVKGTIVSIGKDAVFVDLGGKAEGTIDRAEVADPEGKLLVKIGDTVEARVVNDAGGALALRVKLGRGPQASAELQQAYELGIPVDGLVTEVIKGGVSVDVAGVRGFCPASQMDARFIEDLTQFVGQKLAFRITKYEPRNLVLSRRALLEEENAKLAEVTRGKLEVGAVLRGKVVGFKPFGAFVDLGGIEGMLHVSELGYSRVEKPEDVLSMGQEIDVAIKKLETVVEKGKSVERISLSLKALANDPWKDLTASLVEGTRVKGKITRLQPFGAFVEIAPNVEGLVHISELGAGRRINHPKEIVSEGQEVEAVILAIDPERKRISLSLASSADGSAEDVAESKKAQPSAKFGTFADLLSRKR
ncbi:MAG: S1 RNA-binding domain-containing protein [Deltaproteobacteria bacterium]|nr:S1 RNA-binding domain-containing protein [Deltaproteobacteria bacterium]